MPVAKSAFIGLIALSLFSCRKDEAEIVAYDPTPYDLEYVNNTLPIPDLPTDNPLTVAKVELGRMLFYETQLSLDNSISCASCHVQEDGFSDKHTLSFGVDQTLGKRQAMPVFNMAWHSNGFFWDGRAELLRHQSLLPIQDAFEMKETLENVIAKLKSSGDYRNQFIRAFGSAEITAFKISLALENFMMSIVSDDSKYDRYLKGLVTLTESEERGRQLFFAEYNPSFPLETGADCAHCHAGNNFENDQYMNNGLDTEAEITDNGRQNATGDMADKGKFKVPSLRNIEVTGPYMHDGRFTTLEEVVDHYNSDIQNSNSVDPALFFTSSTGLMLDEQEKTDLVNFLKTLTDYTFLSNPAYQSPF
jgi:cytochrome c peroxidase